MNLDNLELLLKKVLKQFPDVTYTIKESLTTNSKYVCFSCGERKRTVRISDHPTKKYIVGTNVDKKGARTTLERFVINNIKKLVNSRLYDLFTKIEGKK